MAKNKSITSSEETDSVPDDLPSSEKQRHMNPVKFVERAQELVMQQIISNANFGPPAKSEPNYKKRNKSALKQREEEMNRRKLEEAKGIDCNICK